MLFSPFGYALRAARDSPLRAEAIGIDVRGCVGRVRDRAAQLPGWPAALYAFSKGSVFPDRCHIGRSVDALVMVLLGGVQTLSGADRRRRWSTPGCTTR